MSSPAPATMEEWMRQKEKDAAIAKRRGNPFPRMERLELRGLENLAINGDFRINQRGYTSGSALTPGLLTGYAHDRWRSAGRTNLAPNPRAFTTTTPWAGSNVTISRITGVVIPGLPGVTTAIRCTANAAGAGGPYTRGDDQSGNAPINVVAGQTYRVSIWLRSSVAKSIQPSIQWAGGPANSTIGAPIALAANVWTEVAYTITVPQGATRMGPYWYSTAVWAVGNTIDATGLIITEGTDVVPFFDADAPGCVSTGTLYRTPSINRAAVTSYIFSQAPNGCTITLNSGGAIQQVIERANMPAGDYALSWEGTAQARVYQNSALVLLASAATSPLTFTMDGTDDIVVEFEAVGGTATLANVNLVAGSAAYPFRPRPIGEELLLCQRYYHRADGANAYAMGAGYGTADIYMPYPLPVTMRVNVIVARVSSVSHFVMLIGTASATMTNFTLSLTSTRTPELRFQLSAGGVSGGAAWLRGSSLAWVDFTAEF